MHPSAIDTVRVIAGTFLFVMMLSMGLELGGRPRESKEERRYLRRRLVVGLAFDLIGVPLLALLLTRGFRVSSDVTIGFLLLASSPGGRYAPHLARLAGANLGLSVEISLYTAKLVALTAPITARWLLHAQGLELHELPFIGELLLVQLAPYLLGKQLRKRRPEWAEKLARPLSVTMWACAGAVLAVLLFSRDLQGIARVIFDRGWLAVLVFAVAAPLLGWLCGGRRATTRRAFAVEANARNVAIALILGSQGFGERDVQLAVFAVWMFLTLCDLAIAELAGRRQFMPLRTSTSA